MIVDFHTHVFPEWLRDGREIYVRRDASFGEMYADPKAKMATAEDLAAAMDADGVDVAVAMGLGWSDEGLARDVNDYIIDAVKRHPGRLVGFASVNPAWGDAAAREADRCARAGLKGVGELHPDGQGFDMGDAAVMGPLMEAVRHHGLMVTAHSSEPVGHAYPGKGSNRPEALWRFIRNHPDVTLVCAHWGGGLPFYALMPEVGAAMENVYFDTAASPLLYEARIFEAAAALVGAGRILLGSDYALMRPRRLLAQVRAAALPEGERAAIMGGNAARLLGL